MADIDFVSSEHCLWWTQKPEEAAKSLMNLSDAGENDNRWRWDQASYNASILDGIGLEGFGAWAYGRAGSRQALIGSAGDKVPLVWNYPAAGLDALTGKIVGEHEPKSMIMVTDGDWDDQRRAVWSSRLLEGLYRQEQGKYHDVWDMGRTAFKLSAGVIGTCAAKVVQYPGESKLVCELRDTLDMFIDYFECSYSNPLTYGEVTWFDPHRLMATVKSKAEKKAIWDAREPLPKERGGGDGERMRYMVKVVEGWRLKHGKEDGRYLATTKNGPLFSKPYPYEEPPFAFLHARRSLAGFWGVPVMQRGMAIAERINQILSRLDKSESLLPKNLLIYDTRATPKEMMKNIRDVMQVPYESQAGGQAPQYVTPRVYDQSVMNLLESHVRAFHETLGINSSQMSATKDPGIVAAAAIRTVADLFTELHSVISRDWTNFITKQIGSLYLREVQELSKSNPGFAVNWGSGEYMREVKSSICDLRGKKFTFSVEPVSQTRNTPADRIQLADEMLARKELSPQAYQRIIQTGDVPRETKAQNTQYTMIENAIDSWMHDDFEEIDNVSPLPWMFLPDAITQVLDGYMQALMRRKFDPQRELYFRRYITQCDQLYKRQLAEKANLEAQAKGAAPAPGTPSAPPVASPMVS